MTLLYNSGSELVGQIAIYRPGDKIKITYKRNGVESEVMVTLMNNSGNMDVVKNSAFDKLGAELQPLEKRCRQAERERWNCGDFHQRKRFVQQNANGRRICNSESKWSGCKYQLKNSAKLLNRQETVP